MTQTRRGFLEGSLYGGGALLLGCGGDDDAGSADGQGGAAGTAGGGAGGAAGSAGEAGSGGSGGGPQCADPFMGGQQLDDVAFINEQFPPLNMPVNVGWDGRLYFDHSMLTSESLVVPNEHFYIRTRYPDLLVPSDPWTIRVDGLVDAPFDLALDDLRSSEQDQGVYLLECSGNAGSGFGLISAAQWGGILMEDVLDTLGVMPSATQVLVNGFDDHSVPSAGGHSTPGASWIFKIEQLVERRAFLATTMNGEPLPDDHGKPVRLFVPGWYGCTNIKWVNGISLLDDSAQPTSQMIEFATRTHQDSPPPARAKDWLPAQQEFSAMPVRIEKWRLPSGELAYRVVGVLWGGTATTDKLELHFGDGAWQPVDVCPAQTTNATWTLWSHFWKPELPGEYSIWTRINDSVPQIRMDLGWYVRSVRIDEV